MSDHEHRIPKRNRSTPRVEHRQRRFVDPEQLICSGCGQQVRCEPPGYWLVSDGLPAPQVSHQDATALCRRLDGTVGEPIEIEALT